MFSFADEWWDHSSYSAGALWIEGAQAEWPRAEVALDGFASVLVSADLSSDGLGDVIAARWGEPGRPVLEVLCGAPGRALSKCASLVVEVPVEDLAALDVDGDGALDLAFAAGEGGLWVIRSEP